MSALWQTLAYAFRITSIKQPNSDSWYSAWFVLILVAPLWTNAFVYMVMGRMVYNFTEKARIFGVKAWRFGLYFVLLDIIAFLIQVGGASYASGDKPEHQVLLGLHIYMGGVGFQQAFILLFLFLAIRFHGKLKREVPTERTADAFKLLYTLYAVLVLITVSLNPKDILPPIPLSSPPSPLYILTFRPPDPYNIPPNRILQRHQKHHPQSRSLPIRLRLPHDVHRARPLQRHPPRLHHARQGKRLPEPETAESLQREIRG